MTTVPEITTPFHPIDPVDLIAAEQQAAADRG